MTKDAFPIVHQVADALRQRANDGGTDDELTQLVGRDKNSIASARHRLVRQGLVLNSGRTRRTRLGVEATVWILASCAPAGIGLTVTRHTAGARVLTRGGSTLQVCLHCGRPLAGTVEFNREQAVFESEDGTLSAEHLAGARLVECTAARRRKRA